jgi:hypothetical protein
MKKVMAVLAVLLNCSSLGFAFNPTDGALVFDGDTKTVSLSTTAASPTQILMRDYYIARTWIVSTSTCPVYLSSSAASMSFTTSFSIPGVTAGAQPIMFTPDGPNTTWWGALWAASNCPGVAETISIFRSK